MFESFVIMLREGIEAALVIGIVLVVLKRAGRRDLERPVFWGLGLAVLASVGAAIALQFLPVNEEAYEGALYWVSAVFVATMMVWMHRKGKMLRSQVEGRVRQAMEAGSGGRTSKEGWALGAFVFLIVFREGAEAVMFLAAVNLNTDAILGFVGSVLGLAGAIVFCVMFVRGSLQVDLKRFFAVTEWVLGIFVVQLLVNGYHEFSEVGIVPATRTSMAIVGPIVRHNSLFILALVAIPLFIWLTRKPEPVDQEEDVSQAARRTETARIRRERFYRLGAVASALAVLISVGIVYAREIAPKNVPPPQPVAREGEFAVVPVDALADGKLHRLGFLSSGRMVRFLAMKTSDGKIRTALDACEICGAFGYIQEGENLLCLNCAAEINPFTMGVSGGCNPIPLKSEVTATHVKVPVRALEEKAAVFTAQPGLEEVDPVCGMRIRLTEAAGFETYNGKTFYFCGMGKCQALFKADPGAYVKR